MAKLKNSRSESAPAPLCELYETLCKTDSDIIAHMPRLYDLALECNHVTEFGTRHCYSATAFLYAQPDKLICYDLHEQEQVGILKSVAGRTEFIFKNEDTTKCEIEETDLLFIDTYHVYKQLKQELLQAPKVRKYIAMHDTHQNALMGEDLQPDTGLQKAITEFLTDNAQWELLVVYADSCGMTVLRRKK